MSADEMPADEMRKASDAIAANLYSVARAPREVAAWLEDASTWAEETGNVDRHALTVARRINGGVA